MGALIVCSCGSKCGDTCCQQEDDQQLFIGDTIAIANTEYGQVKGFIYKGIYTYLGVPYGASTAGENRFMPPQKPEKWEGIRPTVFYGNTAPQVTAGKYGNNYGTFTDHWNYYDVDEDCLFLNVWTPGTDSAKRPVLVWFHGGGFTSGNGIEQDGYNGLNLSKKGDIVFVSVNHRLGPIGFTDLSAFGPKYAHSGNAGVLDLIAALDWVNKNIQNFGGDPGNVTIMGQSGGGAKTCTVLAMPQSAGKVHKAVALSGNIIGAIDQAYSRKLGQYIVKEAGLTAAQVDKLQEIPWLEYIEIANRAARKMAQESGNSGMMRGSFGPVADGVNVPKEVFYSNPNDYSANVPMIVSTTFSEFSMSRTSAQLEAMSQEQAIEMLKGRIGDKAPAAYQAYAQVFPDEKPVQIANLVSSPRTAAIAAANAKAVQEAPVYMDWFCWEPPLFDGRMRAFHCSDICFWFYNTDLMVTHTGGGKRPRALAEKMSDALLAFMRTGDPNCPSLPEWPEYVPEQEGFVMMLNDECTVLADPDREARKSL